MSTFLDMSVPRTTVVSVAEARAELSANLRRFRADSNAEPVVIGSHRKAEAVLLSSDAYEQLMTARPAVSLARLRQLSGVLRTLAAASNLRDIRVFGSVARGEEDDESDVDLLVMPSDSTTLFDIAQFEMDVEAILGRPVSAVPITALTDRDATIVAESVAL